MKDFIMLILLTIGSIVIMITLLILMFVFGKRDLIFKIILTAMEIAEREFGPGAGEKKHAHVRHRIRGLYYKLPSWIKPFFFIEQLDEYIIIVHRKFRNYIELNNV